MDLLKDNLGIVIGIIGAIIGLIGIWIAIKRKKRLVYTIVGNNLIRDYTSQINKINVTYDDLQIKNLTVSKVALFSKGKAVIDKSDFTKDVLRIETTTEDVKILDYSIVKITKDSNDFVKKEIQDNVVPIYFDYLGKNDGAVYQVIHTGTSTNDIVLKGTLKSIKLINKTKYKRKIILSLLCILSCILGYLSYLLFRSPVLITVVYGISLTALLFPGNVRLNIPKDLKESFYG